ncbi:hypothetical protein GPECTOR_9g683 [Gonium pectorale]|uniref:Uncharacterized protein n=1 Tax=Gonium pectorale TaxID=33097 RepID=A0A150GSH0_GONPE|nr:hypothetical protein GPECTOR_9g683 [Gonium pectorale]|eukprot:KXZ52638.1 hypothetical protein GPECTOR_9g683 [Gonium pectorale]
MAQQAPRVAPLAATSLRCDAAMSHELKAAGAKLIARSGNSSSQLQVRVLERAARGHAW